MSDTKHLALWQAVRTPDRAHTKEFSRGGGFKGTATNATYLARMATEQFGPCGIGWGWTVLDDRMIPGAGGDVVHVVRIRFWFVLDGQRGEVEHYGQTSFVGKNKNGPFTDEEAPKKSLTDAITKCLSMLGFAADIHMGLWDDNKYAAERRQAEAAKAEAEPESESSIAAKRRIAEAMPKWRNYDEAVADWKAMQPVVSAALSPLDYHDITETQVKPRLSYLKGKMKEAA